MPSLELPSVTLCAAASVNVAATVAALQASLDKVQFAECLLFTDATDVIQDPRITTVSTARLDSAQAYSRFMLRDLVEHLPTTHCLVVQWDGFVLNAEAWDPAFLEFDYVGALWPQFNDADQVGNGGFSLRSRRLLEACLDPGFQHEHPEDVAICRTNRGLLESRHGMRFSDQSSAERFSFERRPPTSATFGFHGVFNMIPVLGCDRFWEIYESLDHRSTIRPDYRLLMRQLACCSKSAMKRWRLTVDLMRELTT